MSFAGRKDTETEFETTLDLMEGHIHGIRFRDKCQLRNPPTFVSFGPDSTKFRNIRIHVWHKSVNGIRYVLESPRLMSSIRPRSPCVITLLMDYHVLSH